MEQSPSKFTVANLQISPPTILQKVTLPKKIIKRPIQSVSGIQISSDESLSSPPSAKIFKYKNTRIVPTPPVVPKVKITKNSTSTQTESEPKIIVEEQPSIEEVIHEIQPPPEPAKSKFLAIFECTQENVAKLQKKLEATNGLFDFDKEFLKDENVDDIEAVDDGEYLSGNIYRFLDFHSMSLYFLEFFCNFQLVSSLAVLSYLSNF